MIALTKLTETASTITLGWTPVPGCIGYRFTAEQQPKPSHTWDAAKSSIKFAKGSAWYKVEALGVEDSGQYPLVEPEPPSSAKLKWRSPALSTPVVRSVTNSSRSIPGGSGGDLRVDCNEVLGGQIGEVSDYNDVEMIGGAIAGGSANASGHIIPRRITGTFHLEGWDIHLTVAADAIALRQRTPILQFVNNRIAVTDAGTSYHADCLQTQIAQFDELRMDRCTLQTDYQGVILLNEVGIASSPEVGQWDKVILSRVLFRRGVGKGMWIYLGWPPKAGTPNPGVMELYDVWAPDDDGLVYPATDFRSAYGGDMKRGTIKTTKQHPNGQTYPFLKFSTPQDTVPTGTYKGQPCDDCQVRGDGGLWLGTPPANLNVGCDSTVGKDYVSPGYV